MCKKTCRTSKINKKARSEFFKEFKIEEDYHRSPKQRFMHIICFILPIIFTFTGFFCSSFIWNLISTEEAPEIFKFLVCIIIFSATNLFMFVKTRNTNPTMRIRVSSKSLDSNQSE